MVRSRGEGASEMEGHCFGREAMVVVREYQDKESVEMMNETKGRIEMEND